MQICTKCQTPKDELEFNFRQAGIRFKHCKECQSKLRKVSYEKNKNYFLNYQKSYAPIRRKERRDFIIKFKEGKSCKDCGKPYPHYVLDFDHLPQFDKEIKIASHGTYYSEEKLLEEFAKCDLVCANCHRERTWQRSH